MTSVLIATIICLLLNPILILAFGARGHHVLASPDGRQFQNWRNPPSMRGRVTWPNPPARASQQSAPVHVEARNKTSAAASDKNQINIRDINVAGAYNVRGNILTPIKMSSKPPIVGHQSDNVIVIATAVVVEDSTLNPLVESKDSDNVVIAKKV